MNAVAILTFSNGQILLDTCHYLRTTYDYFDTFSNRTALRGPYSWTTQTLTFPVTACASLMLTV